VVCAHTHLGATFTDVRDEISAHASPGCDGDTRLKLEALFAETMKQRATPIAPDIDRWMSPTDDDRRPDMWLRCRATRRARRKFSLAAKAALTSPLLVAAVAPAQASASPPLYVCRPAPANAPQPPPLPSDAMKQRAEHPEPPTPCPNDELPYPLPRPGLRHAPPFPRGAASSGPSPTVTAWSGPSEDDLQQAMSRRSAEIPSGGPGSGSSGASGPSAPLPPTVQNGSNHFGYALEYNDTPPSGVYGLFGYQTIEDPQIDPNDIPSPSNPNDGHSLSQFWVYNRYTNSTMEFGWTVDKGVNGDLSPHLFEDYSYNGTYPASYDTNFQPNAGAPALTAALPCCNHNNQNEMGVLYTGGNWWVYGNGYWLGYVPDSAWNGYPVGQPTLLQNGGEVASATTSTPCTQMGDGLFGSNVSNNTEANWYGTWFYAGGHAYAFNPQNRVYQSDPNDWNIHEFDLTNGKFGYGGPGYSKC
jgi:hypothetical protein